MAEPTPQVSIVLPVFNEVTHLEEEVTRISKALDEAEMSYEIIVVDDGSTDGSGELAETLEIRVLRFATNRGSGSARKYGTMSAHGEVVVWTDVDMTYPNDQIAELVGEMDGLRPGGGSPQFRGGNSQVSPWTGEMAHQKTCLVFVAYRNSRSQLGIQSVSP